MAMITTGTSAPITGVFTIGLIIILVTRELIDVSEKPALQRIDRYLAIIEKPLLLAFACIVLLASLELIS